MKVRGGFVSNSSSSSFIVCRAAVGDAAFDGFKALVAADDMLYIKEENKNYVVIEGEPDDEELEALGIKPGDYIAFYE